MISEHGFSPALEKTEAVVLTKERVPRVLPIQVGEIIVLSKPAVKYPDIIVDTNISFSRQRYG